MRHARSNSDPDRTQWRVGPRGGGVNGASGMAPNFTKKIGENEKWRQREDGASFDYSTACATASLQLVLLRLHVHGPLLTLALAGRIRNETRSIRCTAH